MSVCVASSSQDLFLERKLVLTEGTEFQRGSDCCPVQMDYSQSCRCCCCHFYRDADTPLCNVEGTNEGLSGSLETHRLQVKIFMPCPDKLKMFEDTETPVSIKHAEKF